MQSIRVSLCSITLAALALQASGWAQVRTDGSLGARQSFSGIDSRVSSSLGQRRGGNLFHSFEQFDIPRGGRVAFTGPGDVNRVVARITGGAPSRIDGVLANEIARSSTYLINPSGFVFGPEAKLDVRGAFTATTARNLTFTDDATFDSTTHATAGLTAAPPSAFGFLSSKNGPIRVTKASLSAPAIRLMGSDISVSGGALSSPGGSIGLAAIRDGEAKLTEARNALSLTQPITGGTVQLGDASQVNTDGSGGGRVEVRAANLRVGPHSTISSRSFGARGGRGIDVRLSGTLNARRATIASRTAGTGAAGPMTVIADTISLSDGGQILGGTTGGEGTSVAIKARQVLLDGKLTAESDPFEPVITGIIAESGGDGSRKAGNVDIQSDEIAVRNGGRISSGGFLESGDKGATRVRTRLLTIDAGGSVSEFGTFTGIGSASLFLTSGAAGDVWVEAERIRIANGGVITALSDGGGRSGSVDVTARFLDLDGEISTLTGGFLRKVESGQITVRADHLLVRGGIGINASTSGLGDGGSVTVVARSLLIDDGVIASNTFAEDLPGGRAGNAGDVIVRASRIAVTNAGGIRSNTQGEGTGGNVYVSARSLAISGGDIAAAAFSVGDAGSVVVRADALRLGEAEAPGFISSQSNGDFEGAGAAGSVSVTASRATLLRGQIDSASFGPGAVAGSVTVAAGDLSLRQSSITTRADFANAGDVVIDAAGRILALDSGIDASSGVDGGNVRLRAGKAVLLNRSEVTAQAERNGARLEIVSPATALNASTVNGRAKGVPVRVSIDPTSIFLKSADSQILADQPSLPPEVDLSNALGTFSFELPQGLRMQSSCAALLASKQAVSSFTVFGREGIRN